jgi:hypothetical protein
VLVSGQFLRHAYASVIVDERSDVVKLHSSAPVFVPSSRRLSFLDRLRALSNQSLWDNFVVDGDGTWIYEGLLTNSLDFMSDGSYNERLANHCCSCAAMIRCRQSGRCATVTWVEKSDRFSADNYRAELLGGIALQLLIHVACEGKYISPSMKPRIGCDNKGVVFHGKHPWRPIVATQTQGDLLRLYKMLVRTNPVRCSFYHVHGHLDQYLPAHMLTPEEELNCTCDKLAEYSLSHGLETNSFISRIFPREELVVLQNGAKLTGNYERAITRDWGDRQARAHYHKYGIVSSPLFDDIYWDGIERVLGSCSEMFAVWATKQVSGFNGNNHLQSYINGKTVDECPNCGCTPERSAHIIFCRSPDRSAVFSSSVDKLVEWLSSQRTDPELTVLLSRYLRARGSTDMLSFCSPFSTYRDLAVMVDQLGYRNLLEGRIPKLFFTLREQDIIRRGLRKHAGHWCNGLILRLLQITHRQWTFRNGTIHLRGPDGLTSAQRDLLSRRCEDLLWTDPSALLEEDRYLLDVDFRTLGEAPAATRQAWLAEMEAARCAVNTYSHDMSAVYTPPGSLPAPVDTEGSIRFRRRRRRQSGVIKHCVCLISRLDEDTTLMAQAVALRAWKRKAVAHGCLEVDN